MILEHQEIKTYLQQRFPMLLVDRVIEITPERAVGIKNVTGTDPFMAGHFPEEPLFPGVLLIEAMGQLGGIYHFFACSDGVAKSGYLAKVDKVKFKNFIRPGDQVVMTAERAESFGNLGRVWVTARVGDQEVGEGQMSYYFAEPLNEEAKMAQGAAR